MPLTLHNFIFDPNFGMGTEPILNNVDPDDFIVAPPILEDFLLLDGTFFLLLNGQNLTLL
jgi:hypothetical protein